SSTAVLRPSTALSRFVIDPRLRPRDAARPTPRMSTFPPSFTSPTTQPIFVDPRSIPARYFSLRAKGPLARSNGHHGDAISEAQIDVRRIHAAGVQPSPHGRELLQVPERIVGAEEHGRPEVAQRRREAVGTGGIQGREPRGELRGPRLHGPPRPYP